jgi:DNA modification methylase
MVAHTPPTARYAPGLEAHLRPVAALREDPANARAHDERNLQAIAGSLSRFGQQKPIVVAADGTVLAGNGTLAAARHLGWERIAAITTDLEGPDARGYAIADNRTAELAGWDMVRLCEELQALPADVFQTLGFDAKEMARIVHDAEEAIRAMQGEQDLDAVPEPPEEATTQPGDLWILGRHRLLCGDSASHEDLDRLLDGAPIHLVNTDPPYNVKVEPRSNNAIAAGLSSFSAQPKSEKHHQGLDLARHPNKRKATHGKLRAKDRPLANDFVTDEAFVELLRAWFGNASRVLLPGRAAYIWGGYANVANYPPALKEAGLYFSQTIIWDKQHPVLTRKDFMGAHEWCFYCWKEGAAHQFYGPNNATDLWAVKKVNPQSMVHLTEKPVELAVRAITYSSVPGENVLDLFGGSGSTLIAAETTQRNAYLMELDPLYADVIVQRFEQVSGQKAERIPAGTP